MTSAHAKPAPPVRNASGVVLGEDVARNQIIMAAGLVFATQGFRETSVDDLLEASGVSRRTFYRLFKSKDDVALAMYAMGTRLLLDGCVAAIGGEQDLLRQLEHCIERYLVNARTMGRIVFVLGGEAQRLESPLHARRVEVHEALVTLLGTSSPQGTQIDPLLIRTLLYSFEVTTRAMLLEADGGRSVSLADVARARAVMMRIASATVAGDGPRVAPIPDRRP